MTVYSQILFVIQDKVDDLLIGVKSLAIYFGENTRPWLYGFTGIMATNLIAAGIFSEQTPIYYAGVAFMFSKLLHMVRYLKYIIGKQTMLKHDAPT